MKYRCVIPIFIGCLLIFVLLERSVRKREAGGALYRDIDIPSWAKLENHSDGILHGGQHKPNVSLFTGHIALVVPYRNRETQLQTFLKHIHPFLKNQSLNYKIFIIELAKNITFNRGALFNIGFKEANKLETFDCFILHDVDLLPLDKRNVYSCARMPRHLAVAIDKFKYRLISPTYVGGAVAISTKQFQEINGFSNVFFGWGGEDNDLYYRMKNKNMTILRYAGNVAKYTMIRHERDQPLNKQRFNLLKSSTSRQVYDGLNSLQYKVLRIESLPLYTWILVSINETTLTATKPANV